MTKECRKTKHERGRVTAMNDDHLETLLRAAGESAGPLPEPSPGLAERVRRLHARRSRNRKLRWTAVVVVLLIVAICVERDVGWDKRSAVPPENATPEVGGTALRLSHPTSSHPLATETDSPPDPEAIKAELARLDAEAQRRQQAMRKTILADATQTVIARAQPDSDAPGPLELVRIEREKTAFLLVDRAEQIGARAQGPAAAEYRRVVELFPNTRAARVAGERLKTL